MQELTVGEMENSFLCMWIGPVCRSVCTVHICTCVFACEIECKLVVSCRPQCRLMPYRQVIYDLSVAGREKGDTQLSLLINKRCSGPHITSPLHVCERTDLAVALVFYFYFLSFRQLSAFCQTSQSLLSLILCSYSLHYFSCLNTMYLSSLSHLVYLSPLVVFVLPPLSAGSW